MIIISKNKIDTDETATVFIFKDDSELSDFITKIISTPVRSSGARILALVPPDKELTFVQKSVLDIIEGLDGIGGNDNDQICDNAINGLQNIITP
jgi:hypothetical protein